MIKSDDGYVYLYRAQEKRGLSYLDPKSSRCLVVFDMMLLLDQTGRSLLHTFAPLLITTTVI